MDAFFILIAFNGDTDRQNYAVTGLLFNVLEKTQMKHPKLFKISSLLAALLSANGTLAQEDTPVELDTVKVSADFRELDLQQIPSAITVVGEDDIQKRNADHLESILSLAPNVNYSAGASRGRYFQIRGIGERSQFIDAVNPSVGLIIDGIDMTGLGGAATLFDVEQVEILRGPQGTAFGANALAGAINIKSKQPTKETEGFIEIKAGNYNTQSTGYAISGPITEKFQARISGNQTLSDGYIKNSFLDRNNTNNIDESTYRVQVSWQPNPNTDVHFSNLKTEINNGYDAFSLDNNRTTYSDQPGKDIQDTSASSIKLTSRANSSFDLEILSSKNNSDVIYAFDEDWAYDGIDPSGYNSTDEYIRNYQRSNIDLKLLSKPSSRILSNTTDWVIGAYSLNRDESLARNYTYAASQFTSELNQTSTALYTELSSQLTTNTSLIYGLRTEDWKNQYIDSGNVTSNESEILWGGKITLESFISQNHLTYASIARGYKAGGVNSDPDVSQDNRTFETEINNTFETGVKSSLLGDTLATRIAVFYIQRKDQQVKSSYTFQNPDNSFEYQDFLDNAAEGRNYGIEIEGALQVSDNLNWAFALGYLKTEFKDYTFSNDDGIFTKDGRSQAHAPEYSIASSIDFKATQNISFNIETEAKDEFYFSDSHDEKSKAYVLLHANISYVKNDLKLSLSGHNLTDKDYAVRGFGFGNDPRNNYSDTQHIQLGAPRLVSLSARYSF
ncbi:MAG: TonB-dependent receptor plug domain-containing protein [Bermanella sp.]